MPAANENCYFFKPECQIYLKPSYRFKYVGWLEIYLININLDHGGVPELWQSTTMTLNVFHDVMRVSRMFFLDKVHSALQNLKNH